VEGIQRSAGENGGVIVFIGFLIALLSGAIFFIEHFFEEGVFYVSEIFCCRFCLRLDVLFRCDRRGEYAGFNS
jgi:hypothetical protein